MKTRLIFLLPLLWVLIGCSDSDTATLNISNSKFDDVSASGETLTVDINCDASWTVTSNKQWCIPNKQKGENDGELVLSVNANLESAPRSATITIISHKVSKTILINQKGSTNTTEEYHYELPVIFHVLYKDENDPSQKVSPSRLSTILNKVNSLYKNKNNSVDMNLTFTLATTDKNGETLPIPGVEYIRWSESYPIDCDAFMNDNTGKYVKYLWDPNSYINIMIYNFATEPNSNSVTLGISYIPFSTTGNNFLEGLNEISNTHLTLANLKFPLCVSINSLYINNETISNKYDPADVTITLAHELGHYLGLLHVFDETNNGTCEDTDHCKDTKSYNKQEYDSNCDYIYQNERAKYTFNNLVKRTGCDGIGFISYNIMDYSISYSNQFTQNQRERIRHVLSYSPLIPGPKKGDINTRALNEEPLDLPIRTIK
ncbi:zinc-dependent metalloproteinase lipoprotein [Bacteroides sp.]|uniref:zinc-dependent metalloproteinase lipoprotein n=1 Tax=Bacteroides sp. TaxID=29523 RepID=UPI0025B8C137|nr:zinc-dependent metalloproteinase lipoprotein [Bacteroides sp.]